MIETWLENKGASVAGLSSNRQRLMDDLGSVISDGTIPDISLWISELIQNALDSTWADNVGAERVELDFEENTFTFSHDGRPPQYVGWNLNELRSMIESGSTKRAEISKEGRFGIGFKYWIYYFEKVTRFLFWLENHLG